MFRWGIIGTGYVSRKFVLGLRASDGGRAVLVHSRTEANARTFASDFSIPKVAGTLEEAIAAADVDAFYIATPPSLHAPQAIACLAAGKPVLVEKPLAMSRDEAASIVRAAEAARTFCMEGMWTRFMPIMAELRETVRSGAVGELRSFQGTFGAATAVDPADNLFNAALGGGALLHRGIYPLAMALDFLGPAELAGSAARLGKQGVDEDCTLLLRHQSGALSTLRASLRAPLANDVALEGSGGAIHIAAPIYRPFKAEVSKVAAAPRAKRGNLRVEALRESGLAQTAQQWLAPAIALARGRKSKSIARSYSGNGYQYEADEVMRCVREGRLESGRMPHTESIAMAGIMEQARASWGSAR